MLLEQALHSCYVQPIGERLRVLTELTSKWGLAARLGNNEVVLPNIIYGVLLDWHLTCTKVEEVQSRPLLVITPCVERAAPAGVRTQGLMKRGDVVYNAASDAVCVFVGAAKVI